MIGVFLYLVFYREGPQVAPRFKGELLFKSDFVEKINSKFQDAKLTVDNLSEQNTVNKSAEAMLVE